MGRYSENPSTDHRVQRIYPDIYRISWVVDRYYSGSRLRFPTSYGRDTNKVGAIRFIKKWGITRHIPEELKE